MYARHVVVLALSALLTSGCAAGVAGGERYGRFRPADDGEQVETVRASGEHFIVARMAGAEGLARLPATTRHLRKGDRLGFTRDERGRLLALAGTARAGLEPVPVGVEYLAWYYKPDRPLAEAGRAVRDGVGRVAAVAADGAATAGVAMLHAALEDDEEGQPRR